MKEKEQLLYCPFCKGEAVLESSDMSPFERKYLLENDGKWYTVVCLKCSATTYNYFTAKEAIEHWNQRAN